MKRPIYRVIVMWAVFFAPALPLRAEANNPWGVMAPISTSVAPGVIQSIKESGAAYLRPGDVWVEEWIRTNGKCDECFKLRNSGIGLILTLRNNGKGRSAQTVAAATPPKDLGAYQKAVGQILESYRPALIAIENEENGGAYYYDAPEAPKEYAKQLSVACEEAQKRNMRCTNGGITHDAAAILTWFQYVSAGQNAKACDYARRALADPGNPAAAEKFCKIKSAAQLPEKMRTQIEKGRAMVQVYRNSPIDFVNLHWSNGDAAAFKETMDYLKLATGKTVISNEIRLSGGAAKSGNDGMALMAAVKERGLPFAVWHHTSRPGGKALKTFLKENYP